MGHFDRHCRSHILDASKEARMRLLPKKRRQVIIDAGCISLSNCIERYMFDRRREANLCRRSHELTLLFKIQKRKRNG